MHSTVTWHGLFLIVVIASILVPVVTWLDVIANGMSDSSYAGPGGAFAFGSLAVPSVLFALWWFT